MKANPKVAEIASRQIDEIRNKKNSAAELKKKDLMTINITVTT